MLKYKIPQIVTLTPKFPKPNILGSADFPGW